ncbi:MAG: glycosyltransferase family 2 protein [Bradyrhizobium sp.]|uniref:glycosyltransferase family 2 protein n=1 Tax=Bradyrhizobium sp. TaxID=376 RepID=UPI0025BCD9F3|nr:glycosyltransferase family 2 protein [Bradyrhizobium sp.]MCA3576306.1 glycosyltransferase family 2 protein [Bradyrhizobium sp.]
MNIAIVMMQKNELDLLPVWAEFHRSICGYQNLHIFDNGSDEQARQICADLQSKGVDVDLTKNTVDHFRDKGPIVASKIHELDASSPADFYFPLDCDEFLGVERDDRSVSFDREDIEAELDKYRDCPHALKIVAGYDNHPFRKNEFVRKNGRPKTFFAKGACDTLDLGFHRGRAKNSDESLITNIVYIHLHYKPLALLKEHARQKLVGRVENFELDTLLAHRERRGQGFHLVDHLLLEDDAAYSEAFEERFAVKGYGLVPQFEAKLTELGLKRPY